MVEVSVSGYPRIGANRELKKATEQYFKGAIAAEELQSVARELRAAHWRAQKDRGVTYIPSNDFSFYDTMLDMAQTIGAVPERYGSLTLPALDTYFAMARGLQKTGYDVRALWMKKWFNTNYHYVVPEISQDTAFSLAEQSLFDEFTEAKSQGILTRPVLPGPLTFLKLAHLNDGASPEASAERMIPVYRDILARFASLGAEWIQIDEPILVTDLTPDEVRLFATMYRALVDKSRTVKILLQTYFGDVRDAFETIMKLDLDAVGLDFVEGKDNLKLIKEYGFPEDRLLVAGVVNGKNIWRNDYRKTLELLDEISHEVVRKPILGTASSLLFSPYSVRYEKEMDERYRRHLAFAEEKLDELRDLARLQEDPNRTRSDIYIANQEIIKEKQQSKDFYFQDVRDRVAALKDSDFTRKLAFSERFEKQKNVLKLPKFPTTTIGSYPQTTEVRKLRRAYKSGEINKAEYTEKVRAMIREIVKLQEDIGLDVLVHGEYERNDMVEYFGENLRGFLFTENGWVQSYGTRGVKPPIIFGDVRREKPITVEWITYAQSLTEKPVKGMLTGPVTILNWSFPREDLPLKEVAYQIALAIRDEVSDLEAAGIRVIQIDEPALREKLPLRKVNWKKDYLVWAVHAFRLASGSVKPETQIHTHMCYSEFADIIKEIEEMDADVISIEAARSDLGMLKVLKDNNYEHQVGPGVYDIHSPRIPAEDEIRAALLKMKESLDVSKIWVNPDCGLKTRTMEETVPSLKNLVAAARSVR
ncbi:MAG TPA: 5-methyltetrahydropteroyltriglutamate--homocysteine S-methyltransferase [Spirochaetia bacterium]|nr:5-methyltetrahydropteroyltriglutamate--homocysteine S-methyltransferase [Spirochaetia bacterium]